MKKYQYINVASLALLLLLFLPLNKIYSIPAFARKYQISCQVCHSPAFPRLKGFGEEFANNGFRMTKYESPRYFIQTGDDRLSLFRELPLAIRLEGFASYNFNNDRETDFGSPFVIKILSGGEISDKISYYFYFLFNELGSVAGIEDAFIMYNDLFNTGITFYIGQFQASDPLFKSELRYTLEPYMIYGVKPGTSQASLKYERGVTFEKSFPTGTTLLAEVVNGNGIGEAGEDFVFDTDKHKNFLLRLTQEAGKNLGIGLFGYAGKEDLTGNSGPFTSTIKMFGPDIKLNFEDRFMLNLQYVWRTDSEVFLAYMNSTVNNVLTSGGFAEVIYSPKGDMSKWYLTGLANWVDSDIDDLDYQSATLHAGYLVRRNLRLVAEYTWQFSGNSYGRFNTGFISAF